MNRVTLSATMLGMANESFTDHLVANLRRECQKRAISQAELSRLCGIHFVTMNRLFQRKMSPSLDLCEKIAAGLGWNNPEKIFKRPA